jgi:hypothetical protein
VVVLAVAVAIIFVMCRKRKSPAPGGVPLQALPTAEGNASVFYDEGSVVAHSLQRGVDYAPIKIAPGDYDQGRVELPAESEYNHGRIL